MQRTLGRDEGCVVTYLVVAVQVRQWRRRWVLPEELPPVRQGVSGDVIHSQGLYRRLRLQNHLSRVNAVTVLFPLPQFTANKTNRNHRSVASNHFVVGWRFRGSRAQL